MNKPVKRIAVTGGAGQVAYSLLFRIANGDLLGKDQPIALHISELPSFVKEMEGVKMELEDCAFPLLQDVVVGSDPFEVFRGVHYALLVGAKPRGPGMERKDLLNENGKIFIEIGKALNEVAERSVKVLVVGNPCNTNCLIAMENAPDIPKRNFFALTRLDQNRGVSQLALKAQVPVHEVSHFAIWGNHSSTMVPDYHHAKIKGRPVVDIIPDKNWLEKDFIHLIQNRGAQIIAKRGKSSAASAANAIIDAVNAIIKPTPTGEWFSSGVYSKGNPYGIAEDLIFSFPCRSKGDGIIEIVHGLELNDFMREKIRITQNELMEEREIVHNLLARK